MSGEHRRLERGALVALFFGACVIGVVPVLVRMSPVGPTATAFWRLALAVPVLLLASRLQAAPPGPPGKKPHWGMLAVPGLFFAGDLSFWHWSIAYTSIANATLLANCAPVFVALIAWRFFGERIRPSFVAGMLAALGGVTLLLHNSLELSREAFLGDLFGIITAGFYAGYQLGIKQLRAHWSAVTVMTWSSLSGAVALVVICLFMRDPLLVPGMFWAGWLVLVAMALAGHIGGQGAIAYASAHLPASFSSVGLLVQPVVAAGVAWALLGEAIGPLQYAGGAIVLLGVYLARRGSAAAVQTGVE